MRNEETERRPLPEKGSLLRGLEPARTWANDVRIHRAAHLGRPVLVRSDLAAALGISADRVAKLVFFARQEPTERRTEELGVALIPVNRLLDLDAAAGLMTWPGGRLLQDGEFELHSGFSEQAISPVCPPAPLVIDETMLTARTIVVPSGLAGVDVELAPQRLAELTGAPTGRLSC